MAERCRTAAVDAYVLVPGKSPPDHRRIDRRRARLLCSNRRDNVVVTMTVLENEFEYATRKLIHATNEIFMIFLRDGPYAEYIHEVFGASH